ncbi:MAG: hypothetical protein GY858_08590 [Candidatus Omnitrophica bacterium]|nr:hypothetical protein [Candidatus Omnitrophota bacterium]
MLCEKNKMINELFKSSLTGPLSYKIFSFVLIAAIFIWIFWGNKIAQKQEARKNQKAEQAEQIKQRPWVDVDFEIMTPLSYDNKEWDAGTRWHVTIKYRLENVGKTPANKASFMAKMIPLTSSVNVTQEFDALYKYQQQLAKHNMGFGQTLFPEKKRIVKFVLNGNPRIFDEIKKNPSGYAGHFLVIVCATYNSTYNNELFHTAKAFQLFKRSGNKFIDPNGETIPVKDLAIVPHPIQGSRAE